MEKPKIEYLARGLSKYWDKHTPVYEETWHTDRGKFWEGMASEALELLKYYPPPNPHQESE
jgi:hypothetical protein